MDREGIITELEITNRSQQLLELLTNIPPKFDTAKSYLEENLLSSDEVTSAAIVYADRCSYDFDDYICEHYANDCSLADVSIPRQIIPEIHSAYLYDVVKLLLGHGLDPNAIYQAPNNRYNIMELILFMKHEYIAADTMALLLENGGDPNLLIDSETIYEIISDDIWFGAIEQEIRWIYDSWVHVWMVLLAYGGKIRGRKSTSSEVFREYDSNSLFDVKKLKDHRNYFFGISKENYEPVIHIYDKKTLWEVARA